MKKIAIYVRVSTQDQDTGMQKAEIYGYLGGSLTVAGEEGPFGGRPIEVYEDKASGTTSKRIELMRLIQDVAAGQISQVICWKLDRVFRSLKDLVDVLHFLQENNVEFIAVKDGIDLTTATGRLTMHVLGAVAEFEAALLKERVTAGVRAAIKERGGQWGRPKGKKNAKRIEPIIAAD